ncbi:phytanoyl-CoA dioxygenase [Dulcicalothrix desertica PCC 7102]|uniref:Phytanoyl-CoA dioxygenase n=1 Tax=Dulcicalothrix desertica PCC 7102 TaxID=232991 RepID=A0A3S1AUD4_9CYAN|nr:phytanoyl-CoA dioxygenase family protein [Dulcicalothrix desertica]RUT09597.1 phytanoyl-CoA dioxygenase [Dulcicalothrix desertica PCC 7102]TWH50796.1 Protein involved in biosynthesis of mitomycin antibiotics/polyketide fumonisin [Dulcicalothrix desertica PCC 7102]
MSRVNFLQQGYTIIKQVISEQEVEYWKSEISKSIQPDSLHGARLLQETIPIISDLAYSSKIIDNLPILLNINFQLVRALYFDKTSEANWSVAWHQDKTIAVKEKVNIPGYEPWSIKQGVVHVQPPVEIMESIITVRIHLDDADAENGALRVIPKSHLLGILTPDEIRDITAKEKYVTCNVEAGDALIMSPLILHSSLKAKNPKHRRVIHLEYAFCELPECLSWY